MGLVPLRLGEEHHRKGGFSSTRETQVSRFSMPTGFGPIKAVDLEGNKTC